MSQNFIDWNQTNNRRTFHDAHPIASRVSRYKVFSMLELKSASLGFHMEWGVDSLQGLWEKLSTLPSAAKGVTCFQRTPDFTIER